MRKSIVALSAVLAAMSFASLSPLMAADDVARHEQPAGDFTKVSGTIKAIEGKTLTLAGKGDTVKTVVWDDKTVIVKGKTAYTEPLKVGDQIVAKVNKEKIAIHIQVRVEKTKADGGERRREGGDK